MAYVEKIPGDHGSPDVIDVALKLDAPAHERLIELMQRTGLDESELIDGALDAYWRELEGVVLPPPQPEDDIEKVLMESEEDMRAGRTSSNEEVFGRIAAKHGW